MGSDSKMVFMKTLEHLEELFKTIQGTCILRFQNLLCGDVTNKISKTLFCCAVSVPKSICMLGVYISMIQVSLTGSHQTLISENGKSFIAM